MPKYMDKYQVEDALRTLERAKEIQKDKDLMEEVKKFAKDRVRTITSIADLKAIRDEKLEEKEEEDSEEGEYINSPYKVIEEDGDTVKVKKKKIVEVKDEMKVDKPETYSADDAD